MEHDDVVDAVDELGAEVLLHDLQHRLLHLRVVRLARQLLDHVRAEVRGHDDDGVAEVDGAALTVGQAAVVENLQQHVEHVRVRLLDFVEQQHGVRATPHGFGQIAAFFVADVAGRCADQARDRVLLHELGHVDADHRLFRVEQEFGERLAQLGLADAGRAEEQERAVRSIRIGEAGTRAADRIGYGAHCFGLADDALRECVLHVEELLALAFEHLRHGDAGPLGDDFRDFLFGDLVAQELGRLLFGAARGGESTLELGDLAVCELGHAREILRASRSFEIETRALQLCVDVRGALDRSLFGLPDLFEVCVFLLERLDLLVEHGSALLRRFVGFLLQRLALDLQLDHAAFEAVHRLRLGVDFHADARRGFVDQVDRLVGQLPVGDVAMRERRGRDDRGVGDADAVVNFVALLQAAQDRDRVLDRRLVDEHFLEAALQRGILLDVLAILVERRRADAVELAARERRLEHVAGVHRAFGLACADHRVQLVDEQDDAAFLLREVVEHRLEALLELTAILRAGDQRAHVERENALVAQAFRHLAVDDALCEAFDDRSLADAGLADQHGVVLGAAL